MNVISNISEKMVGKHPTEVPMQPLWDNTKTMKALCWHGSKDIRCDTVPRPMLTHPRDVILRVTATTICGSDLHIYRGNMMNMKAGDILGHEFMGIIDEAGSEVKNLTVGQRVVVSFNIICGDCQFCKRQEYTGCSKTNTSNLEKEMYGHRTSGFFGYSHMTGGVPGGQAEYVRIPYADNICLPIPDSLPDEKVLFLSDIIPTSYFGTELANVKAGDNVAIWGLGPVGLLCAKWCKIKGAKRVVGIDCIAERLEMAASIVGIETINFKQKNTVKTIHEMFPEGVDCAIECAGFDYPVSMKHTIEFSTGLETDSADIFEEMFMSVRPFGSVGVLGVYVGKANHFPVGAMMEKALKIQCGQCPVQKFWPICMEYVKNGTFDPTFVMSHHGTLDQGPEFYKKFNDGETLKIVLRPMADPQSNLQAPHTDMAATSTLKTH